MIVHSNKLALALLDGKTLLCRPCAVEKYGMGVALVEAGHSAAPPSLGAEAEASYQRALDVARRRGALTHELRAAMGLSSLWRQQGKRAEARELLANVYERFTEGFDCPDLKSARVLLDALKE